jgi:hypothetical protein
MTPKEKAKELIDIYKKQVSMTIKDYSLVCKVLDIDMAKQCALIAVEEMLDFRNKLYINEGSIAHQYLLEVKQKIEKL